MDLTGHCIVDIENPYSCQHCRQVGVRTFVYSEPMSQKQKEVTMSEEITTVRDAIAHVPVLRRDSGETVEMSEGVI